MNRELDNPSYLNGGGCFWFTARLLFKWLVPHDIFTNFENWFSRTISDGQLKK